jgi:ADP-ribosyl-[dinitrogen reductase] hydrolase
MQMPGKGTFNVKPGQFTDDSEMASHMLEALCFFNPKNPLKDQQISILFEIAQQYVNWYNSDPFDIGMTTTNALNILSKNLK